MTTEVQFKIDSEFPTCWNKEMHTYLIQYVRVLWYKAEQWFFFIIWGILFQLDKV